MGTIIAPFVIYLLGALLLPVIPGRLRHGWIAGVTVLGLLSVALLPEVYSGWILPFLPGIDLILLSVDPLSLVVGYIFAAISILAVLYACKEMRITHQAATLLQVAAGMGIVFAGDFVTLFLFWELLAISSLLLIWHGGAGSIGPGYRYALMHILGGVFLLGGIAIQFRETGSLMVGLAEPGLATILFILGIGMNAAMVPLHAWLPDAYPKASIAGSVVLCVFTTKAAIYLLARTLPGSEAVMYLGAIMIVYGIVFALLQDDMRTLLSYHIVSQVGYMVAAIGIGTALAVNGGIAHLFNHIFYKALLFMVAGAIIYQTGFHRLSDLGGLRKQMPLTFAFSIIASAAIAGVPGFNGYISKEMIVAAASESGLFSLEILFLIGSVGTFLSFVKLNYYAFLREKPGIATSDPPAGMQLAMGATAFACILYGLYPALLFGILPYPVTHTVLAPVHVIEMIVIFGLILLILWKAGSRIRMPAGIPPDFMDLYRVLGAAALAFSRETLPALAVALTGWITSAVKGVIWFMQNPVLAVEIFARSAYLRICSIEAARRHQQERISLLKSQYPGTDPQAIDARYGPVLISLIIFAYFLTVFIF
ncbi:MAG: Na(+)/H(+) antiporter subunit D [Methanocalculus sp. MSAO_Arc1]|uniref:Na(+)/H(+) antiporter subunit D n=1 Tax=Methanocalculus TaxID=71151 RepID=UPI000FECEC42|nr:MULTISPECIES: Na(+)/H(+) antiporter subunit D [unclassified Methanocalculus]MCP1662675.1 multicomponent Na+:H+ antiporter subunit D [Methanocalculus sp. AMF5]RQD80295.1 MAG: Na(+)/H(+) antiporter subunit D [Methanocalculus sp. MSAO_Arc1]